MDSLEELILESISKAEKIKGTPTSTLLRLGSAKTVRHHLSYLERRGLIKKVYIDVVAIYSTTEKGGLVLQSNENLEMLNDKKSEKLREYLRLIENEKQELTLRTINELAHELNVRYIKVCEIVDSMIINGKIRYKRLGSSYCLEQCV